jgi:hypothetical protein
MTFEEGSLCEPLAVALAGLEKANVRLGDPVVVWYVLLSPSRFPLLEPYHSHIDVRSRITLPNHHYHSDPFETLANK